MADRWLVPWLEPPPRTLGSWSGAGLWLGEEGAAKEFSKSRD